MRKRLVIWSTLVLVFAVAAVFLVPRTRQRLEGWWAGEPFYEGRPLSAWLKGLKGDADDQAQSTRALCALGPTAWAQALQHEDVDIRRSAVRALAVSVEDPASTLRACREDLALVGGMLKDDDQLTRQYATRIVGRLAPDTPDALPYLDEALADRVILVRVYAAQALATLGPAHYAKIMPVFVQSLENNNPLMTNMSAAFIASMGPAAKQAVPKLIENLKNIRSYMDLSMNPGALRALSQLRDLALPDMVRALKHENAHVRYAIAFGLGNMGNPAATAVPALHASLDDASPGVRLMAARALSRLQPDAGLVLPLLRKSLKDPDQEVRNTALMILEDMRGKARPALPDLREARNDPDLRYRDHVDDVIKTIEDDPVARDSSPPR